MRSGKRYAASNSLILQRMPSDGLVVFLIQIRIQHSSDEKNLTNPLIVSRKTIWCDISIFSNFNFSANFWYDVISPEKIRNPL